MAPTSEDSKPDYNWDNALLSFRWIGKDWRPLLPPDVASALPWEELQTSTIEQLGLMHDDYDRANGNYPKKGEVTVGYRPSPAIQELDRRDEREEGKPSILTEARDARDWVQDRDRFEDGRVWQQVAPESEDWVRDEETKKDPFFTVGFELELPIAVYRRTRGGIPDPHPNETRWLADISDENGEPDINHVRQVAVNQVLNVLRTQTSMVFRPKESAEKPAGVPDFRNLVLNGRLNGITREDYEKPAHDAANLAVEMFFNPVKGGKRLVDANENDIQHASMNTPIYNYPEGCLDRVQTRLGMILRKRILELQCDPRHVELPHMKFQYRAFSVYAMPPYSFMGANSEDYVDSPKGKFDPYHWEIIKISSPVMRIEPARDILAALQEICRVMRNNFRVHRDMPSIPVTTQANISNRAGFDLIDIKRFVSLVTILRDRGFHQLNRAHRSTYMYDDVCGSIKRMSRLGGLADMEYASIEKADDWTLPQPPDDERTEKMLEMERNLPKDLIPALQGKGKLSDRIFFAALWSYATITDMARALSTSSFSTKAEVMVKVTGNGTRSNFIHPKWSGRFGEDELFFNVVDSHRGVLEFRQCGGSLDPHHILCWLVTCCCVVNSSKSTNEETFNRLVTRILSGQEYILDVLEIDPAVQQFYRTQVNEQTGFFEPAGSEVKWADPFYPRMP